MLHTGRKQRTPGKESKKGSVDFGVAPSVAESLSSVNCKKEYSEKIDPQKVCEDYLYPSVQPGLSQQKGRKWGGNGTKTLLQKMHTYSSMDTHPKT